MLARCAQVLPQRAVPAALAVSAPPHASLPAGSVPLFSKGSRGGFYSLQGDQLFYYHAGTLKGPTELQSLYQLESAATSAAAVRVPRYVAGGSSLEGIASGSPPPVKRRRRRLAYSGVDRAGRGSGDAVPLPLPTERSEARAARRLHQQPGGFTIDRFDTDGRTLWIALEQG